jgi:dihydroorotate dehydrogenase electron transfer subunit
MTGRDGMLPQPARIRHIAQESGRVKLFVLDAQMEAVAGQFVMLWLPGQDERPFSLVSADPMTLLVAKVGPFTHALHELQEGDWLWWRGPFGNGFRPPGTNAHQTRVPTSRLLLAGGGYGVAPLAFAAQQMVARGWPVTAVIGARSRDEILLRDSFEGLGCQVLLSTEDGTCGHRGLVTKVVDDLLQSELAHAAARAATGLTTCLYGCGPEAMLEELRAVCSRHRLPCQLSYEAVIKCAFGVCGSCARHGLLICKDGPVLKWSEEGDLMLSH